MPKIPCSWAPFPECPLNKKTEPPNPHSEKDEAGFEKFQAKRKAQKKIPTQPNPKGPRISNSFDSLANLSEKEAPGLNPSVETQQSAQSWA
jgi:hypothetical protein